MDRVEIAVSGDSAVLDSGASFATPESPARSTAEGAGEDVGEDVGERAGSLKTKDSRPAVSDAAKTEELPNGRALEKAGGGARAKARGDPPVVADATSDNGGAESDGQGELEKHRLRFRLFDAGGAPIAVEAELVIVDRAWPDQERRVAVTGGRVALTFEKYAQLQFQAQCAWGRSPVAKTDVYQDEDFELRLYRKGAAIQVRVVDKERKPIAGVTLECVASTGVEPKGIEKSAGRFVYQDLPEGPTYFEATKDGYFPARRANLHLQLGDNDAIEFELQPAALWRGRVVDELGRVLGGTLLFCDPPLGRYARLTRVREDGRFELGPASEGLRRLYALHREGEKLRIAELESAWKGIQTSDIVLRQGLQFSGRFFNAAELPVDGGKVELRHLRSGFRDFESKTDREGRFVFPSLFTGPYRVTLRDPVSGERLVVEVNLEKSTEREFRLRPKLPLTGVAQGPRGPLAGVLVEAFRGVQSFGQVLTGKDGYFNFEGLPQGLITLIAKQGYRYRGSVVLTLRDDLKPTKIEMLRPRRIRCRVLDHEGKPIAGAYGEIQGLGGLLSIGSTARSRKDGLLVSGFLVDGTYRIGMSDERLQQLRARLSQPLLEFPPMDVGVRGGDVAVDWRGKLGSAQAETQDSRPKTGR